MEPAEYAPLWESSASLHRYSSKALGLRTLAHVVLIITPAALGLLMNWRYARFFDRANGIIWWIGAAGTALSFWFLVSAHWWRRKLYHEIEWQDTAG